MATGTTFDFQMTRDEIIQAAYSKIGQLADGENLTTPQSVRGIQALNLIMREVDGEAKWLWAVSTTPTSVTLVANQWVYSTGIPTNALELIKATYRDAQANDLPLKILTTEQYADIENKVQTGQPQAIYWTEARDISGRSLYVWPTLASVNTQSVVTGTDANAYRCIRSHTSVASNRPTTGANYLQYWELGGSGPSAWATGTSYTAPQQIRMWYKRPLFDFDTTSDTPDFPAMWTRFLIYRLANDLADNAALTLQERQLLAAKAEMAYDRIFRILVPGTTEYKNKAKYF